MIPQGQRHIFESHWSCLVNWICNAIIGAAYPPINEAIGGKGMIILYKQKSGFNIFLKKSIWLRNHITS